MTPIYYRGYFYAANPPENRLIQGGIKKMIGHQINDLTEKVYTKRDPDWLKREIEKIM